MKEVYAEATQFSPASNDVDTQSDRLSKNSKGRCNPRWRLSQVSEYDSLNTTGAQPLHENIVLVKQNNRLEAGLVDTNGEVKQRLMGTANSAVVIAFDHENARPGGGNTVRIDWRYAWRIPGIGPVRGRNLDCRQVVSAKGQWSYRNAGRANRLRLRLQPRCPMQKSASQQI